MHGHEFELYAYEELRGLPEGCTLRDAGAIQPREQVFRYRDGHGKGSPAGFANLFRYKLLAEKGGWWVDTDVLCLASDLPEAEVVFAPEEPGRYNVAIMKFPAGLSLYWFVNNILSIAEQKLVPKAKAVPAVQAVERRAK